MIELVTRLLEQINHSDFPPAASDHEYQSLSRKSIPKEKLQKLE